MKRWHVVALGLGLVALAGCGGEGTKGPVATTPDGQAYLLPAEPSDAQDVIPLRQSAEDGATVVVVGRVGGSENPWVAGRAAFWIVDRSLPACSDRPDDNCPKPWDYCCDVDRLPAARLLVKVVDAAGQLVATDARQLLRLKELETVVVQGTARLDEAGNLTVLAAGLFVRPDRKMAQRGDRTGDLTR